MSGTNTRIGDSRTAHLAVVEGPAAFDAVADTTAKHIRVDGSVTGYSGGAEPGSASVQRARIATVARRAASFEGALRSMVLAAGVPERAADAVASAISSNTALRERAEAAFRKARQS